MDNQTFLKATGHRTNADRVYKWVPPIRYHSKTKVPYQKRGDNMSSMKPEIIKNLFEQTVRELTAKTVASQDQIINYQFSGGWIRWI